MCCYPSAQFAQKHGEDCEDKPTVLADGRVPVRNPTMLDGAHNPRSFDEGKAEWTRRELTQPFGEPLAPVPIACTPRAVIAVRATSEMAISGAQLDRKSSDDRGHAAAVAAAGADVCYHHTHYAFATDEAWRRARLEQVQHALLAGDVAARDAASPSALTHAKAWVAAHVGVRVGAVRWWNEDLLQPSLRPRELPLYAMADAVLVVALGVGAAKLWQMRQQRAVQAAPQQQQQPK